MRRTFVFLLAAFFLNAYAMADEVSKIENGKKVKFDYTLKVDGKEVESSVGKTPLEYVQGNHMIIPGLENQLAGLKVGDQKKVTVPAADAYGQIDPKMIIEVPKNKLAPDVKPVKGMVLQMATEAGQTVSGVITDVKADTIILDFNHPFAGQDLSFDIKIEDIK